MTEFRINKKDMIERFKEYVDKTSTDSDTYSSKGKEVQYRNDYTTLDKLRTIYRYIIKLNKIDLRREYIHDDNMFYQVLNSLYDRVNNKIRSKSDGTLYMVVGVDKPITFDGDDDQYKKYVYLNKSKQQQLIRKIVDELNSVLEKKSVPEKDKPILTDDEAPKRDLTTEEIADMILANIPSEFILELHKGKFDNFDRAFNIFIREYRISESLGRELLGDLHSMCAHNDVFWSKNSIQEAPSDKLDPVRQRHNQSVDTLRKKGLKAAGGVWKDSKGKSVARVDDRGNIEKIDSGGTAAKAGESISQAIQDYRKKYTPSGGDEDHEAGDEEVETGLEDKELEAIRQTFEDENEDERKTSS